MILILCIDIDGLLSLVDFWFASCCIVEHIFVFIGSVPYSLSLPRSPDTLVSLRDQPRAVRRQCSLASNYSLHQYSLSDLACVCSYIIFVLLISDTTVDDLAVRSKLAAWS